MSVTPVPKPGPRQRLPRTKCPLCGKMLTAKAMLRHHGCGRKNRFGSVARKTVVPGVKQAFPSRLEAEVWGYYRAREIEGRIRNLKRYPSVELLPGLRWKVDIGFEVVSTGEPEWAEAKGVESERYRVLLQVWRTLGPGKLTIWKADRKGVPYEDEIIIPRPRGTA